MRTTLMQIPKMASGGNIDWSFSEPTSLETVGGLMSSVGSSIPGIGTVVGALGSVLEMVGANSRKESQEWYQGEMERIASRNASMRNSISNLQGYNIYGSGNVGFAAKGGGKKNWIQDAVKKMKKKGTVGSFSRAAKRAGMSTAAYANKIHANPSRYSHAMRKKANFARNVRRAGGGDIPPGTIDSLSTAHKQAPLYTRNKSIVNNWLLDPITQEKLRVYSLENSKMPPYIRHRMGFAMNNQPIPFPRLTVTPEKNPFYQNTNDDVLFVNHQQVPEQYEEDIWDILGGARGTYKPYANAIGIFGLGDVDNTLQHELVHSIGALDRVGTAQIQDLLNTDMRVERMKGSLGTKRIYGEKSGPVTRKNRDSFYGWGTADEIYPRIFPWRIEQGYKPGHKYTPEDVKKFLKAFPYFKGFETEELQKFLDGLVLNTQGNRNMMARGGRVDDPPYAKYLNYAPAQADNTAYANPYAQYDYEQARAFEKRNELNRLASLPTGYIQRSQRDISNPEAFLPQVGMTSRQYTNTYDNAFIGAAGLASLPQAAKSIYKLGKAGIKAIPKALSRNTPIRNPRTSTLNVGRNVEANIPPIITDAESTSPIHGVINNLTDAEIGFIMDRARLIADTPEGAQRASYIEDIRWTLENFTNGNQRTTSEVLDAITMRPGYDPDILTALTNRYAGHTRDVGILPQGVDRSYIANALGVNEVDINEVMLGAARGNINDVRRVRGRMGDMADDLINYARRYVESANEQNAIMNDIQFVGSGQGFAPNPIKGMFTRTKNSHVIKRDLAAFRELGYANPKSIFHNLLQKNLPGDVTGMVLRTSDPKAALREIYAVARDIPKGRQFAVRSLSTDSYPVVTAMAGKNRKSFNVFTDNTFSPLNDWGNKGTVGTSLQRGDMDINQTLDFINSKISNLNSALGRNKIPNAKIVDGQLYVPNIIARKKGAGLQSTIDRNQPWLILGAGITPAIPISIITGNTMGKWAKKQFNPFNRYKDSPIDMPDRYTQTKDGYPLAKGGRVKRMAKGGDFPPGRESIPYGNTYPPPWVGTIERYEDFIQQSEPMTAYNIRHGRYDPSLVHINYPPHRPILTKDYIPNAGHVEMSSPKGIDLPDNINTRYYQLRDIDMPANAYNAAKGTGWSTGVYKLGTKLRGILNAIVPGAEDMPITPQAVPGYDKQRLQYQMAPKGMRMGGQANHQLISSMGLDAGYPSMVTDANTTPVGMGLQVNKGVKGTDKINANIEGTPVMLDENEIIVNHPVTGEPIVISDDNGEADKYRRQIAGTQTLGGMRKVTTKFANRAIRKGRGGQSMQYGGDPYSYNRAKRVSDRLWRKYYNVDTGYYDFSDRRGNLKNRAFNQYDRLANTLGVSTLNVVGSNQFQFVDDNANDISLVPYLEALKGGTPTNTPTTPTTSSQSTPMTTQVTQPTQNTTTMKRAPFTRMSTPGNLAYDIINSPYSQGYMSGLNYGNGGGGGGNFLNSIGGWTGAAKTVGDLGLGIWSILQSNKANKRIQNMRYPNFIYPSFRGMNVYANRPTLNQNLSDINSAYWNAMNYSDRMVSDPATRRAMAAGYYGKRLGATNEAYTAFNQSVNNLENANAAMLGQYLQNKGLSRMRYEEDKYADELSKIQTGYDNTMSSIGTMQGFLNNVGMYGYQEQQLDALASTYGIERIPGETVDQLIDRLIRTGTQKKRMGGRIRKTRKVRKPLTK